VLSKGVFKLLVGDLRTYQRTVASICAWIGKTISCLVETWSVGHVTKCGIWVISRFFRRRKRKQHVRRKIFDWRKQMDKSERHDTLPIWPQSSCTKRTDIGLCKVGEQKCLISKKVETSIKMLNVNDISASNAGT